VAQESGAARNPELPESSVAAAEKKFDFGLAQTGRIPLYGASAVDAVTSPNRRSQFFSNEKAGPFHLK
jgi:hypothetical protein